MYEIECNNCRETNQLHDRMKGKTVRCHICQDVIQVGEVKKELIRNINRIDDHENRIQAIEDSNIKVAQNLPIHYVPVYSYPTHYGYPLQTVFVEKPIIVKEVVEPTACEILLGLIIFSGLVGGAIWVFNWFVSICNSV